MSRTWSMIGFAVMSSVLLLSCSDDKATDPEQPTAPIVSTAAVSGITESSADCGGTITSDGGAVVTARGVCWSASPTPTIADSKTTNGSGTGTFTCTLTGLSAATPYYARAYATNSAGTGYGAAVPFTTETSLEVPTVTTAVISEYTQTTATCGGTITSDGGSAVTARGICWSSTNSSPSIADDTTVDGNGIGSFTSLLTGLTAATPYYVRAYATNSAGTGYGAVESFTTQGLTGTVTDIDGNVYQTIAIGTQVWMAENLKVTHYRNGDPIPNVTDGLTWDALATGAYCEYDNSADSVPVYGRLYNWYAATDSRMIAPEGWHVPGENEWQTLVNYVGADPGGQLKEAGTAHWLDPNTGATNSSGFNGLPAGGRGYQGVFLSIGQETWFWTTTEGSTGRAYVRGLWYWDTSVYYNDLRKASGFSIRCVKD